MSTHTYKFGLVAVTMLVVSISAYWGYTHFLASEPVADAAVETPGQSSDPKVRESGAAGGPSPIESVQTVGGPIEVFKDMPVLLNGNPIKHNEVKVYADYIRKVHHLESCDIVEAVVVVDCGVACDDRATTSFVQVDKLGVATVVGAISGDVSVEAADDSLRLLKATHETGYRVKHQTWLIKDGVLNQTSENVDDPVRNAMAADAANLSNGSGKDFSGKPAYLLYTHAGARRALQSMVMPEMHKCVEDFLNNARELAPEGGDVFAAELTGSHADSWYRGYIGVSASGDAVAMVLNCNHTPFELYYLVSNTSLWRGPGVGAVQRLNEWAREGDAVRRLEGAKLVEYRFPNVPGTIAPVARQSSSRPASSSGDDIQDQVRRKQCEMLARGGAMRSSSSAAREMAGQRLRDFGCF